MSSKYILISSFKLKENLDEFIFEKIISESEKKYFISEEIGNKEIIELRCFNNIEQMSLVEEEIEMAFHELSDYLLGDISRELIKFVESPLESSSLLPESEYIQLRHVEVPPSNYSEYRKWREETIFSVVKDNKDKIESFEAYHSIISGQPGVMFISSFNGDVDAYKKIFNDDRYKEIVRQAGDSFITGDGLYTRIYRAC